MKKWYGLTLYPFIFFQKSKEEVSERLLRHEYQHVIQIDRMGWIPFYATWLWQRATKGYYYAPLEVEARAHQDEPLTEEQKKRLGL